jgi:type VI secretion system secreted protein VgrG
MTLRHGLAYELELGGRRFPLDRAEGREALGAPFVFSVSLDVDPGHGIEPERYLRSAAAVVILDLAGVERRIDGIVTDMAVAASAVGAVSTEVTIEPAFALARHRIDMRVFREATTVDIVTNVLGRYRAVVDSRLARSYVRRPQCVQYRESDLDFVHRLLEEDGISYFVMGRDRIVLVDDPSGWEVLGSPSLPFRPGALLDAAGEAIVELQDRAELGPALVSVRSARLDRPRHAPRGRAEVFAWGGGLADVWARGTQRRDVDGAAARLASAYACDRTSVDGRVASARVAPGWVFEIEGSPLSDRARDRLLCTALNHSFAAPERSGLPRFRARPAEQPFHPLPRAPLPEVHGPMVAFVVGPAGEELFTDELGRVKIRYPWDRENPATDAASHWVPVAQDMTGHSFAIPRVGWEVLVDYIDADPDRPVVLGRLYNAAHPFPEALPEQKTVSALRSFSTPGRGGSNEIRIDDAAGSEAVSVLAERDQEVAVANDRRRDVGADRRREVKGNEDVTVGANATKGTAGDASLVVGGRAETHVGGDGRAWVGEGVASSVAANAGLEIGGAHLRRVVLDDRVTAASIDESVGGVALEASLFGLSTDSKQATSTLVGGAFVDVAVGGVRYATTLARAEVVGALSVSRTGLDTTISARTRSLTVGGACVIDASDAWLTSAPELEATTAGHLGVDGAGSITLRITKDGAAVSEVVLANGVISIKAPRLVIEAPGDAKLAWAKASITEG